MGNNKLEFKTHPDMLEWQYSQILWELGEIQRHDADPTCPCRLSTDLGENCLAKHSLGVSGLAAETMAMDSENVELLDELAGEAREKHKEVRAAVCSKGEAPELMEWSRQWRKRIEPIYYACQAVKKAKVHDIDRLFEPITITGKCIPGGTCDFKVKNIVPDVEISAGSVTTLDRAIKEVSSVSRKPAAGGPTASRRTYAQSIDGTTRYEFLYSLTDVKDLIVSHDPFTFTPNPDYPRELQPRLRERAATRLQVENIAANINPAALIDDYHSIDRGAPIIGPDHVVESGNGRVMALLLAERDHPDQYLKYKEALRNVLPLYGMTPENVDHIDRPILVRERLTEVNREQFVREANASTSIESSAVEKARTDATLITTDMIVMLDVLDGEGIEEALRAARNKPFVTAFLGKLSPNEQARLVDAKGQLNQDGVRRTAMALFVATFSGDVGIRLAEKFYESTDLGVRNVFNGIARSLGLLARAESLAAAGERRADYAIGEDLAKAITVFSAIKKTPGMTVAKYQAQLQLEQRELTVFQERLLTVLDEYSRSAKRIASILGGYATAVINSPPPSQVSMIPEAVATKEELFETAVRGAVDASLEDAARLFQEYIPRSPQPILIQETLEGIVPAEYARFEVTVNLVRSKDWNTKDAPRVNHAEAVQGFFELMRDATREWLLVICLNEHLNLVGLFEQAIGTHNYAVVDTQELARIALMTGASQLILAHNHPSGNVEPSSADLQTFGIVKEALKLLQIEVLDFFVVGHTEDYSMSGMKTLPAPPNKGLTPVKRTTPVSRTPGQAKLFDYSWLAGKIDRCDLTPEEVAAALRWRPLREFIAFAVGPLGKPVSLCSQSLAFGTYRLVVKDVATAEMPDIAKKAAKVPNMKRVYIWSSRDLIYQVALPAENPDDILTWRLQAVHSKPVRKESVEQAALFSEGVVIAEKKIAGPVIRITGKCDDPEVKSCVFKIRKVGKTITVRGQKALAAAIDQASYGRTKIAVRMAAPAGQISEDSELEEVSQALDNAEVVNG